ncbi:hypothetical protein MKW98_014306 [Papaver atlanticum]|uniref:RRM domain-containing protein n=1 Tax=Papaver atlanticum TaxID=357466 RepID=A0AAD4SWP5_9MAGN|nr:hypothetical protein MKW98_014306 [Papaver atlanticum]
MHKIAQLLSGLVDYASINQKLIDSDLIYHQGYFIYRNSRGTRGQSLDVIWVVSKFSTLTGLMRDGRVMWDHKTGRSRGFGFVAFRSQQEAQSAINDFTCKWLWNRKIRCNWAVK